MRRGFLLSGAAFRYPQLYGQRGLAERATEFALPPSGAHGVQIPFAGLLPAEGG
jgi:hypothetical protein